MSLDTIPKDQRGLRACKLCALVKSADQFMKQGCDNCEPYLGLKQNREAINECTSQNFDGMVAMMSPNESWVAKWQRIEQFVPGVYAVSVSGELPMDIIESLKDQGKNFVPRDRSTKA